MSDLELVEAWQNGGDWAFERIYKRYAPKLLAHAMHKTDDRESSEELVQDTFMLFFKQKTHASNIESLPAYLHTILKNKILDHYRHKSVLRKYEVFASGSRVEDAYSENHLEIKELNIILSLNINKLPQQCKKVFKMSRENQLSNKEIAKELNISENTVEQHMRKALRLLRKSLTTYGRYIIIILIILIKLFDHLLILR